MPAPVTTKPNVFIIESLKRSDEKHKRREGRILSEILHLSGKESEYLYIRTRREFEWALQEFKKSDFRYLHISCHANSTMQASPSSPHFKSRVPVGIHQKI